MAPPVPLVNPTTIAIQDVVPQGSFQLVQGTGNAADLTNGNKFINDGTTLVHIFNGSGNLAEVHFYSVPDEAARTGTSANNLPLPNASIGYQFDMPNGEVRIFGPFRQAWWNQRSVNVGHVYLAVDAAGAGVVISPINY